MLSEKDQHFRNKSVKINHDNILKTKEAKNDVNVREDSETVVTYLFIGISSLCWIHADASMSWISVDTIDISSVRSERIELRYVKRHLNVN